MTTLITMNLCARNLLVKLANISEHRMGHDEDQSCQIKKQLHHQCKVSTTFIIEETALMVSVKLWLGRCRDASLNHGKQDKTSPWFHLLTQLIWSITIFDIPIMWAEKMETMISCVRKLEGVPRCLSNFILYGHSILDLPLSRLVEVFTINAPK